MTDAISVMSGAEADVSSDGDSSCFEDEIETPLPLSPLKEGTDAPFYVVLKGGRPWGFTLKTGSEAKSSIVVDQLLEDGKAAESGQLKLGDYILEVNEIRCTTLEEAEQLIDSAFRTLTLKIWRGSSETLSTPVRSASFLQKNRELSERARQAASVQDDSILYRESNSRNTPTRMKPRQRRIESFHGSRRGSTSNQSSSSSGTPASITSPRQPQQHDPTQSGSPAQPVSSGADAKPGLKGWATENDLSSRQQPVIMSGSHMMRNMPLQPAKSSPSLNNEDFSSAASSSTPRGYHQKSTAPTLNMAKSTTDIPENLRNYENVTSPTSPTGVFQKLPNRMFDFTTSSSRRSPRNSYASGSPRNSYSSYSSTMGQPTTTGFSPMSLNSSNMYRQSDSSRSSLGSVQNQKLTGANSNSYNASPGPYQTKNYDRRSLPPQLHQMRPDVQREVKSESQKLLTSMPVTREEDDVEKEVPNIKPCPPNDLDLRPMYSPPAPPVRDISSLKYVKYTQNHEKYPSWPVTMAQPPNLGPPIDALHSDKGKENSESSGENSDKNMKVRSSPVERRSSEEKQVRNQSDPFRRHPKKSFYTTRKPKEPDYSDVKPEGERFDEFCKTSKPGYPPPKLDQDGHNYGDEKYNIPSPPERDVPNLDEKSLVEKIAAVISPHSQYQSQYQNTYQYNVSNENTARTSRTDIATSPMQQGSKLPGMYFQQAMNAQNLLKSNNVQNKNMVDSGTSPIHSPTGINKDKYKLQTVSANPRAESLMPSSDRRPVIVKQLPFYNTSTQTDEHLDNTYKSENESLHGKGQVSMPIVSSNIKLDSSSQSSGIGSMNFSDQSSAGMLRKLSEEFFGGKLNGVMPSDKRMSSASTYDELRSPRSMSQVGLREAESYSSVVIHPDESSGLFGRDDLGSSPSLVSSKLEVSDNEHEAHCDARYRHRASLDAGVMLNKAKTMPPRGLQDSRFTSESNLSSGNYSSRNSHSQSLMQLDRQPISHSSLTSTSSQPRSSMEARSSGSRVDSTGSRAGSELRPDSGKSERSRLESDSVFYENTKSPGLLDNKSGEENADKAHSVGIGRKESMKMAFGTYDENEHHYATPYGHIRNSSEVLSPSACDPSAHNRSMSFNDYMPMHYNQTDPKLGLIKEEGSEMRWQEAVQKSRSLSRESSANYENFTPPGLMKTIRSSDSDKSDTERKTDTRKQMRRTASEQIRPRKERASGRQSDSSKGGYTSSSGESSKGNKSDNEGVSNDPSRPLSQDLKKVQQKAVFDFVERKKKGSDSGSDPQSPQLKNDTSPNFPPPPIPDNKLTCPPLTSSPLGDLSKRYKYTQQQRGESLRRTLSITSTSSRESDYMEMKRNELDRPACTEWKRLRSLNSGHGRRPLSIGSDASSLEGLLPGGDDVVHRRSSSETVPKHIEAQQNSEEPTESAPTDGDNAMLTAPIYHNLGAGPGPRRPPPPVPGVVVTDEKPPALPPRKFASSKSESYLLARMEQSQKDHLKSVYRESLENSGNPKPESGKAWEANSGTLKEDAYAQQLRIQAKRYSEQHKPVPIPMQVVSTKSTVQVSLSQSYKQERNTMHEAIPAQRHSPQSSQVHTEAKQVTSLHSPPMGSERLSPDPPPMPTPMKNGETEINTDLNKTADFPPPPLEFIEGKEEQKDRCADDSYGSYKTQATREVGKYKRATSDTSLLRTHVDHKPFRPTPDFDVKEDSNTTPNKPPRKKLEMGGSSPNQGRRSKSPNMVGSGSNQRGVPQVHAYQPPEVSSVTQAQKYIAKPLKAHSPNMSSGSHDKGNSGGNFVGTVVQRPASINQNDRNTSHGQEEGKKSSVKDKVKNFEVFSHTPGSNKPQSNGVEDKLLSPTAQQASDSLEQLESSTRNDSFKDRLRPVVKKNDESETEVSQTGTDNSDSVKNMPPMVPNRTYKHQTGWKDQFPNHRVPKQYENKPSANINPVGSNNFMNNNYKSETTPEMKRTPGQSQPEPQVPSRSGRPSRSSDPNLRDQNISISSQDSRTAQNSDEHVQNKENTQVHQSGQKRNYEKSFSRNRHSSDGSTNSSTFSDPHSIGSWQQSNTQNDKPMGSNSVRSDSRADNYKSEQNRARQYEKRSPKTQPRYNVSPNQRQRVPDNSHSTTPNSNAINQSPASIQRNEPIAMKPNPAEQIEPILVNHVREPSAEELECDLKAQELAKVLKDRDKELCNVLNSDSKKNRMQYLDGIFPTSTEKAEERRPRSGTKNDKPAEEKKEKKEEEPTSPMPSNYYVSPPKAMIELEIRKLSDNNQLTQDLGDNDTLAQRKEELLQSMLKKVDVLKEDKMELVADIEDNEMLGQQVAGYVEKKCRSQQEKDKFKSYIEDIDKIIRLLLKLSGLLARAENTIQGLTENDNERVRKMTYDKRDRLFRQHEDAKELKIDIDRRSQQLEEILQECLLQSELDDYHIYLKMKSKYTIQMQELEDKITLGQEQITALQKSIPGRN